LEQRINLFHDKKHSKDMGKKEIEEFLTHLAVDKNVLPTTQNKRIAFCEAKMFP